MSQAIGRRAAVVTTSDLARARRPLAVLALALALVGSSFVAGRGIGSSLALLTAATQAGGNAFTAGTWVLPGVTWYLHNNPTPPVGNTTVQANLGMNTAAPTAAILYNYDTNADSAAGRRLVKSGSGPSETNLARYASWRSPVLAGARSISGTASFAMWSAVANFATGRAGSLRAYLRDYNPSTGTYVEIASGTTTAADWQAGSPTWVFATVSIAVAGYTVPAGHQVEVKVMTTSAAYANMWIAYDMSAYASSLTLP